MAGQPRDRHYASLPQGCYSPREQVRSGLIEGGTSVFLGPGAHVPLQDRGATRE